MLPDRVSNPGPLTDESGALPIALRGPATHLPWRRCRLKRFSYFSSGGHFVQQSRTILAILEEDHPRNISVKLF